MNYDGSTLNVTITDTVTLASASQSYTVNIPVDRRRQARLRRLHRRHGRPDRRPEHPELDLHAAGQPDQHGQVRIDQQLRRPDRRAGTTPRWAAIPGPATAWSSPAAPTSTARQPVHRHGPAALRAEPVVLGYAGDGIGAGSSLEAAKVLYFDRFPSWDRITFGERVRRHRDHAHGGHQLFRLRRATWPRRPLGPGRCSYDRRLRRRTWDTPRSIDCVRAGRPRDRGANLRSSPASDVAAALGATLRQRHSI